MSEKTIGDAVGMESIAEAVRREWFRTVRFGRVRPVIHATFNGYKFVAVGEHLLHSNQWRTFIDFLNDYIKWVFTPAWGKFELTKPWDERHEIMKWYDGMCRHQHKQQFGDDGLYSTLPNGAMRAYLLLAYDLFTLQHHGALPQVLIDRLKDKREFQGARHELFAASACIRAGYQLEYEDERDSSRRHPEFIATHTTTGQRVAVEAKSRHRDGILGFSDKAHQQAGMSRAGIERLLKDAIGKLWSRDRRVRFVSDPYVIFFDLNLPPFLGHVFQAPWFREVADSTTGIGDAEGNHDPFNLIVFSNQPDHYLHSDSLSPGGSSLSVLGRNPQSPAKHPEAILAIHKAVNKYGTVPNFFEEAEL